MKAVITGTPVQIEGEPAEIAQLVELLSSGAVMVEHVHHWRLELPDDDGLQLGKCWCGTEKTFAPFDGAHNANVAAGQKGAAAAAAVKAKPVRLASAKKPRTCKLCGGAGHDARKCPSKAAA